MTHDELLAFINDEIEVCEPECYQHQRINTPWLALRAVVELHKPDSTGGCNACEEWTNEGPYQLPYPCRTIEAIEKELV